MTRPSDGRAPAGAYQVVVVGGRVGGVAPGRHPQLAVAVNGVEDLPAVTRALHVRSHVARLDLRVRVRPAVRVRARLVTHAHRCNIVTSYQ